MKTFHIPIITLVFLSIFISACQPKINLFSRGTEPYSEHVLKGDADKKVLLIPVQGILTDTPKDSMFRQKPSVVQEVVSQLNRAKKDKNIGAVVLKINSPGGSTTASDILYHEISSFQEKTNSKVVACFMNVAASGGYYISLPSDHIVAHPTSVTGSTGTVFLQPKAYKLMQKIGLDMQVTKSGKHKDMGTPFRENTPEEEEIFDDIINQMGDRFLELIEKHRPISNRDLKNLASARIYSATQAKDIGLVDDIGYLDQALSRAKDLANLPPDARVVVYRRTHYAEDNMYNDATTRKGGNFQIMDLGLKNYLHNLESGFYYLWIPKN